MAEQQDEGWLIEKDSLRIEFIDIGEGLNGDYDPSNPQDDAVLCVDVLKLDESGQWLLIDEAFCRTNVPVSAPATLRQQVLEQAMAQISQHGISPETLQQIAGSSTPPPSVK